MTKSSRLRDRWDGGELSLVTQDRPEDIDAPAGEAVQHLGVDLGNASREISIAQHISSVRSRAAVMSWRSCDSS